MTMALLEEKIEFAKLFIINGLVTEDYLTVAKLRFLYNEAVSTILPVAVTEGSPVVLP